MTDTPFNPKEYWNMKCKQCGRFFTEHGIKVHQSRNPFCGPAEIEKTHITVDIDVAFPDGRAKRALIRTIREDLKIYQAIGKDHGWDIRKIIIRENP